MGWAQRSRVPAGTIAVFGTVGCRYTAVAQCVERVARPAGTVTEWIAGSANIALNRNLAASISQGDWLWMLDDDQVFAPDCLLRMLTHLRTPGVDVVVPHVLHRTAPHQLVAETDDATRERFLRERDGLMPVTTAGTGGMLLRREVLAALSRPWFEVGQHGDTEALDEDRHFCRKARAAGFGVYCDLGAVMGHVSPAAIWPVFRAGLGWGEYAYQVLPSGATAADTTREVADAALRTFEG